MTPSNCVRFLRAIARELRRSLRFRLAKVRALAVAEGRISRNARIRVSSESELEIASMAVIESGAILAAKPGPHGRGAIRVGRGTYVGEYCNFRTEGDELVVGADCLMAQFVSLIASGHEFRDGNVPIKEQRTSDKGGIVIGDGVWIGVGAVVLPGVQIGDGVVIAAGSVVTKSVEPLSIVAGNPARVIGKRT